MIRKRRPVTFEQRQQIYSLHLELGKEPFPIGFFLTKDFTWAQTYIYQLRMELRKLVHA